MVTKNDVPEMPTSGTMKDFQTDQQQG